MAQLLEEPGVPEKALWADPAALGLGRGFWLPSLGLGREGRDEPTPGSKCTIKLFLPRRDSASMSGGLQGC